MIMERNLAKKPLSPQNFSGVIGRKRVSIPHQSRHVMRLLKEKKNVPFEELFDGMNTRGEMVATFMAVLELIRDSHMIVIENKGKIVCQRCDDFDGYDSSSSDD